MVQEERITMLELRHSPWCEGLDCVDSLEEPLPLGAVEGEEDLEGGQQEGSDPLEDTISSSLQLVLPVDFASSRVNSKAKSSAITLPCMSMHVSICIAIGTPHYIPILSCVVLSQATMAVAFSKLWPP